MSKPLSPHLEELRSIADAQIRAAFKGVRLENGVSWGESIVIARYGSREEQAAARKRELDVEPGINWESLIDCTGWFEDETHGGMRHLDPLGFRYYIPALMIRALRRQRLGLFGFSLAFDRHADILNAPQALAIKGFIEFFLELAKAFPDRTADFEWIIYPIKDTYPFSWGRLNQENAEAILAEWRKLDAPRPSIIPAALLDESREVEATIRAAFHGVTRVDGVSWTEAEAIDGFKGDEACAAARRLDQDSSWEQLVDDPKWHHEVGVGGFNFLDPIGFRYYIAPAMIRLARGGEGEFVGYALDGVGDFRKSKYELFTRPQLQATARFVRFMAKLHADLWPDPLGSTWEQAYGVFWHHHDSNANGDSR